MKIDLDEDEVVAVIEFQKSMREAALDSCEYNEAEERLRRINELVVALKKFPKTY